VGAGRSGLPNRHRRACLKVRYHANVTKFVLTYRPSLIHEYRITKPSLHAAMSVGLETRSITEVLNRLSKIPLPAKLEARIKDWTSSYGKIRLVLKHNKYFLESSVPEFLRMLLNDPVIAPCKVIREDEEGQQVFGVERGQAARRDYFIPGTEEARRAERGEVGADGQVQRPGQGQRDDVIGAVIGIDQSQLPLSCYRIQADKSGDELDEDEAVHSFEVASDKMEVVRRQCQDIDLPALEEYDFRNDTANADLDIQLKPMTVIRPYQETSLAKMFGNGRARSGIIVLPCGAGKTLVGITAACTIKKSTMVLCTSA
jgi:DNA excision repair protein ERCC-3